MSEIYLSEETKTKLIRYVAKLLKSEDEKEEKPYNALFGKELNSKTVVEGATGIDDLTTGTRTVMNDLTTGTRTVMNDLTTGTRTGIDDLTTGTRTGLDVLKTQTRLMNLQIDDLTSKIHGNEQKATSFDNQYRALQIVNKAFLYIYFIILVGVKGLMVFHYISGTVLRNVWVDSIVLTLLFIYPYTIYSLEVYIYNYFVWIASLIYNSASGSEFESVFSNTSVYRAPDPEYKVITTA